LRNVIAAGALDQLEEAAIGQDITHNNSQFSYHIPVPDPEKIICVGVNFPDCNAE